MPPQQPAVLVDAVHFFKHVLVLQTATPTAARTPLGVPAGSKAHIVMGAPTLQGAQTVQAASTPQEGMINLAWEGKTYPVPTAFVQQTQHQ